MFSIHGEELKPVPGFYEIHAAASGRIYSTRRGYQKELSQFPKNGYVSVGIFNGKRTQSEYVHLLVLAAWAGPRPTPEHECCHGDGNRQNCRLTNLRWDTPSANTQDAIRHGTAACLRPGHIHGQAKLTLDQAREVLTRVAAGEKRRAIAASLNISTSTISDIVNRQTWRHLGPVTTSAAA